MKHVIATLKADDNGEGFVTFTKDFERENAMYRADVLIMCLYAVHDAYNAARKELGWGPAVLNADEQDETP